MDALKELIGAAKATYKFLMGACWCRKPTDRCVFCIWANELMASITATEEAQQSKTVRVWVRVNNNGESWVKVAEDGRYWYMSNHMAEVMFGKLPAKDQEAEYEITTTRIEQ